MTTKDLLKPYANIFREQPGNAARHIFRATSLIKHQRNTKETPKKHQSEVKQSLNSIYNARNLEEARRLLKETLSTFESEAPNAMKILEEGFDDVMAVMSLPKKYRQRFRTSNGVERLNEEIRRRDRVIRIYPNSDSVIRLIGALLMDQDERWTTGKKYLDMQDYKEHLEKEQEKAKKRLGTRKQRSPSTTEEMNLHTF